MKLKRAKEPSVLVHCKAYKNKECNMGVQSLLHMQDQCSGALFIQDSMEARF